MVSFHVSRPPLAQPPMFVSTNFLFISCSYGLPEENGLEREGDLHLQEEVGGVEVSYQGHVEENEELVWI